MQPIGSFVTKGRVEARGLFKSVFRRSSCGAALFHTFQGDVSKVGIKGADLHEFFARHDRLGGTLAAARLGWAREPAMLPAEDVSCALQVTYSPWLALYPKLCSCAC